MPNATKKARRRCISLPDGRVLRVRLARASDVDGLEELYAGLNDLDRYRRFFSMSYRPRREFFEDLVAAADRGGAELVAAVLAPGATTEEIVGECGYFLLPNGNGELAIAIAEGWRGWLGPYLLDALVYTAAGNGVPNLEADVLVTNRPMISLASARGAVVMDHSDMSTVRLLIGTGDRAPTWPAGNSRGRVLVEGVGTWHGEKSARQAGLDVLMCPGPSGRERTCPLLAGRACPLAAGADAIVVAQADDGGSTLVEAHQRLHSTVPVCVEPHLAAGPPSDDVGVLPRGDDSVVVGFLQRMVATHR
jgi:RimJ/RimL family protein N-acetyltransferase